MLTKITKSDFNFCCCTKVTLIIEDNDFSMCVFGLGISEAIPNRFQNSLFAIIGKVV